MSWHAALSLRFRRDDERTLVHDRHDGPLRVLRSLHPEGPGVCHSVLVHPPGGIVGGDTLAIELGLGPGAHALVTTPGATRFYRSSGALASQTVEVRAEEGARLEWLPLETIAFSGCIAENRARFALDRGAEMIGWDVTALGLPASDQPFVAGDDLRLLDSPLGWAGHRVLATLWFAAGSALADARREALLQTAHELASDSELRRSAGASAAQAQVVVVRVLAPKVEPAMALLTAIWSAWRRLAWNLPACAPRVWRT